ncbi:acetyl/propionyl-CoA carboxylase subuit alpha [Sphaerisporangium krabiense]|uniref:Propionyl-CoA carboxylase alpha chain n=1 Tax=Sphaerisporangium krabiense TaxID=763782 RepID=A0A7W8ZAW8_9ACTN|nr:biotin carboxylase N-terminal domain-containing protein [Sphaerisporangium krabiense]MBB5630646.1 propionyl-CoA carboxylase alpha chain [Sphaerisporangium krabiense]GII62398.1 acetyl/propionyl-CoA carboxylase subuit alpha [Sphaerisporangium krabiense]
MIGRLLVANRAEIARRVFRTCRDLGIETVAVFSDADASAPHAAEADHAVRLPGTRPADTYLDAAAIVAAALGTGADAVHPGYGFLSENAAFARAVLDAGLVWVGPPPEAIAAMGAKIGAKALMAAAGVPVLPSAAPGSAADLPFPVLLKASAGGGGRGMRVVRDPSGLAEAAEAAGREALAAFGDGTLFAEPLLEGARHVEVQIVADAHGTVWALGERDCSIQRRHQKVVEEAPAPGLAPRVREELLAAAVKAAEAIGYVGAGTVEFLVKGDTVAFLEMNTRLQVEHPVTECVYGVDLVRLQLEVAEGARLPAAPPGPSGHAIEARLYAEDPADGWRPQAGTLGLFEIPGVDARFGPPPGGAASGLRLDSGVETGSRVDVHYDPMLAKVIAWAPTRAAAARRLAAALARARVHGPVTNRDLLVRVLRHETFLAGDAHTGFLETFDPADGCEGPPRHVALSALAAALALAAGRRAAAPVMGGLPSGWRNVPSEPQRTAFEGPAGRVEVAYRLTRAGLSAEGFDGVTLVSATPARVVLEVAGVRRRFEVAAYDDAVHVDSPLGAARLTPLPRLPEPAARLAPGSLLAPMPGTVLRVAVTPGARVAAGQTILTLEAMKMEHEVRAPAAGVLSALNAAPGLQVAAGTVLAVIETAEETP